MEAYIGDENGGDWKIVRTGELVVVPGSVRHAWRNRSDASVRVLSFAGTNIFAVMRKVAIPAGQTQAVAPPTVEFLQELQEVAAGSGNWLATPEENAAIGLRL